MAKPFADALRLGETAYSEGDFDDALRYATEALTLDPSSVDALDLKANALAELGRWEAADQAFAVMIEREPTNSAVLLAAADVKIRQPGDDRERVRDGLELIERAWPAAKRDRELYLEAELLRGVAHNQLGECELALDSLARVLEVDPRLVEARLEAAMASFELGRFAEARRALERLVADEPDEPWAHHYLGLLAERAGQGGARHFEKAHRLAPEEFPRPVQLSPADFDRAVADAIEALPAESKPHLDNVVIGVEPLPSDAEIAEGLSPTILGVFHGTPVDERRTRMFDGDAVHVDHQTARITLFQKNLERFARTREELLEEIRITVLHEVGHLLGLDEDELYERGLD